VRGEGCVTLLLESVADGDGGRCLALLRGSATNQDGRSSTLTAPNGPAQQSVIREALASGGIAAGEVGALQLHGTGTPLGTRAVRRRRACIRLVFHSFVLVALAVASSTACLCTANAGDPIEVGAASAVLKAGAQVQGCFATQADAMDKPMMCTAHPAHAAVAGEQVPCP
jgi:hypothetical protein